MRELRRHDARGERIGQVDYLLGTNKNRFPGNSPPRRRARWPRARRSSGRRSRTATGRSGRACPGRQGSPFTCRSRASTGPTSRSPTAGAATRCPGWRSCATRRTWPSTARRGAVRSTWPPPSGSPATSAGHLVRFWQIAQLVLQLGEAKREGTLDRLLADAAKARLLVLDEFK